MHKVLGESTELFAVPLAKPPSQEAEWKEDVFLSPFWWVSITDNEEKVNMVIVEKGHNPKIPCLVNNRVLNQHEKLYRYKAKAVVAPLASAARIISVEEPTKRIRR